MKKLFGFAVMVLIFAACGNSGEGGTEQDTINTDVNTNVPSDTGRGDTSSYERMPGTISDTMQR